MTCCLAGVATNLVPLLLELGIFEDLGHKQGSMQGWVGVHGTSYGLHQPNLSAATQEQDLHAMAGASDKKQPQAVAGASGRQIELVSASQALVLQSRAKGYKHSYSCYTGH